MVVTVGGWSSVHARLSTEVWFCCECVSVWPKTRKEAGGRATSEKNGTWLAERNGARFALSPPKAMHGAVRPAGAQPRLVLGSVIKETDADTGTGVGSCSSPNATGGGMPTPTRASTGPSRKSVPGLASAWWGWGVVEGAAGAAGAVGAAGHAARI